jgi:hypothetical protein
MSQHFVRRLVAVWLVVSLLLTGCGGASQPATVEKVVEKVVTQVVEVEKQVTTVVEKEVEDQRQNQPLATETEIDAFAPGIAVAPRTEGQLQGGTTGGNSEPNDEPYGDTFYKDYGVNPFLDTAEDRLSTFAVDVDTGSYTIMRRYLTDGYLPPSDAVRVEEYVNFFKQGYAPPDQGAFRIVMDGAPSPFGENEKYALVRVGLKGREIASDQRKDANLVFVIDVSGSMAQEDRLGTVKQALQLLVERLRPNDKVAIVVYGDRGEVLMQPTSGQERDTIMAAIERLVPTGSTNAEEGLVLGYEQANQMFDPNKINALILCADGVANVGATGPENILKAVLTVTPKGIGTKLRDWRGSQIVLDDAERGFAC